MRRTLSFYRLGRVATDAVLGFAAFVLIGALASGFDFSAAAVASPRPEQAPLAILAVVFSSLAAFNLAILRHLRRVYASPRRGAWRRG